jgi:hypothetical protein
VTDPDGGRSGTTPGSTDRPPLRIVLGVPVAFAGLVAVVVAYLVVGGRLSAGPQPRSTSATGSTSAPSDLAGEWSGKGSLTHCAGFEDDGCPGTRSVTLTIDCSKKRCAVTPFDRSYGSPPLRFEDGRYRAAGPVPADVAPTCGGVPTHSALWRLELTLQDGRLGGSYAESTVQGFNCGATGVAWQVTLDRT